ncbi:hypothetical protein [Spirosoma flavum]|uniref:RNA polymerase sigma-70 region 2 domain-containing protein n=1 Tax=Spirosoma flavum TaxID=2048557 RepID=A0ABW6AU57_9BACT
MNQDDTVNKGQTNEYPPITPAAMDSFEYVFALYRSRVHDYFYSLFVADFPDKSEEKNTDIH